MQSKIVKSPLNYTGGKYKLLPQLLPLFPKSINTMVDLFCGGCNVGVNVSAQKILAIDYSDKVIRLMNIFKTVDKNFIIQSIEEIISKYNLSNTSIYGYEHYGCNSSEGLAKVNKDNFIRLRTDLNNFIDKESIEYFLLFYVLIIYSFNNQIRFNSKNQFNIPTGKRDFNDKVKRNLFEFLDRIKNINIDFVCDDFKNIIIDELCENDFVYADPPYLITTATYNEQGAWTEKEEKDLYKLLDSLNDKGIKFALSNVLECKGRTNDILKDWCSKYNVNFLNFTYSNSNYQIKDKTSKDIEVLITNYKI